MELYISPKAGQDLEVIGDYIAQDNSEAALQFVLNLRTQCQRIGKYPLAYPASLEYLVVMSVEKIFVILANARIQLCLDSWILRSSRRMTTRRQDELTEAKQDGRE